ncbi:MAG: DNA photolyase family protein [Proteobacteria bacterium]|jgi:deoxyribodipyrimidine photo-lyase|nr:DNA photolyase family protein [Pseudomonadota bacterium]
MSITIFWHRRDLRTEDNRGLSEALSLALEVGSQVRPLFIFDRNILSHLDPEDTRVPFLHSQIKTMKDTYKSWGCDFAVYYGDPLEIFQRIITQHPVKCVVTNHDYEPYARERDEKVSRLLKSKGVEFKTFKDQVIFEKNEVLSDGGKPYTVFTPYKKKWLSQLSADLLKEQSVVKKKAALMLLTKATPLPTLEEMGFKKTSFAHYPPLKFDKKMLHQYGEKRDFPALQNTSQLGLHFRFGTVSPRTPVKVAKETNDVWLSELIWREFFMQILFHHPRVEKESFRIEYEKVEWRTNEEEFQRWSEGSTGFPIVDAGMRQLNETGYMHNRVRMIVASFLTKHLLMHWLKGERYFAKKLLDFDLSANNGNWQWAAGTGCDAAPYFRVFNPDAQTEKFDEKEEYIRKWVPEYQSLSYPKPMVDHKMARDRALRAFAKALKGKEA